MPTTASASTLRIALVGNPNTGKSTLFSALAGVRQRVGNYPGVTVEKKTGQLSYEGLTLELIDLPGTYSLAPHSPDELVTVEVLLGRLTDQPSPTVVLSIVDASNLERNLFLLSQVLSLGLPTVVALNMIDIARQRDINIDIPMLAQRLGVPVIAVQANRHIGLEPLKKALTTAAQESAHPSQPETAPENVRENPFPANFRQLTAELAKSLNAGRSQQLPHFLVERLLLDGDGYLERELLAGTPVGHVEQLRAARQTLAEAGTPVPAVEAMARYDWVGRVLEGIVKRPDSPPRQTTSDRIDTVLTHKVWGTLVLVGVMALLFSSIFVFANPLMGLVDSGVGRLASWVEGSLSPGALRSLLVDGVIGGVGAVLVFLPQILILFFFIAMLEDCGYMARAAFLMDRLMAGVGLSGRSFIPLLSSFACAVPGIMAARVIENRRDRLATILIAPLMSCSARLPVYVILIGAFVPARSFLGGLVGLQGLTLLAMYAIGIFTAVLVAWLLKRTLLRGETPPFVMELPSYKMPSGRLVLQRMVERGWGFVRRAGTVIVAVTIVVWAMAYYPRAQQQVDQAIDAQRAALAATAQRTRPGSQAHAEATGQLAEFDDPRHRDHRAASLHQRYSLLGQAGQWIEPVVRPLGWDWRIGCAAIASFPAREVVMGVLGVIYHLGPELDVGDQADQNQLQQRLRTARWDDTGRPVYNLPVALSLMVFFALCAQCAATLAVIRRETGNWWWPALTFTYMTLLAYVGALVTYQVGMRL
jgi:ferrous iron transport protein B